MNDHYLNSKMKMLLNVIKNVEKFFLTLKNNSTFIAVIKNQTSKYSVRSFLRVNCRTLFKAPCVLIEFHLL